MARGILQHSLRQRTSSRNDIISGDDGGGGTILPLTTGGPLSKQPKHQHMHRVGRRRRRKTTRSSWEYRFKLRVIIVNIMICIIFISVVGYMFHRVVINHTHRHTLKSTQQQQHVHSHNNNDKPLKDNSPVLCSLELNQYCPPSTTCCPKKLRHSIVGYSCLVSWSSRVPQGPCCDDDIEEEADFDAPSSPSYIFGSGCAAGYTCAAPLQRTSTDTNNNSFLSQDDDDLLVNTPHCKRDDAHDSLPLTDKTGRPIINDYEHMPRYVTCPAFSYEDIALPHGLPIPLSSANSYDKSTKGEHSGELYEKSQTTAGEGEQDDGYMGQLAYFSNMGPLATDDESSSPKSQHHADVTTAVIGIHGSGRDAGSYLCAMIAAVNGDYTTSTSSSTSIEQTLDDMELWEGQERRHIITSTQRRRRDDVKKNEAGKTLLISPWFLAPKDGEPESSSSTSTTLPFLQWLDKATVEHTFRYGAESIPVSIDEGGDETTTSISSYGAMDVLLETLCNKDNYPNLERIIVAGHSAGGQFVHRWGLSSDSWCFGDNNNNGDTVSSADDDNDLPSIRVVAANPRSYAYLDKRRYFTRTTDMTGTHYLKDEGGEGEEADDTLSPFNELDFRQPTASEFDNCQEYNQYCWGLEDNPNVPAPYIINNVDKLMRRNNEYDDGTVDNSELFSRYATRDVVYLSGERDTKQLGNQICDEDGYQGPSRRERSERFYASLQVRGDEILNSCRDDDTKEEELVAEKNQATEGFCAQHLESDDELQVHDRIVVRNVGHDHALIFQSREGRKGMFSDL